MDFEVRRDDLRATRVVDGSEGNVRIDRFALTANNVTYAVMGDAMRYWTFFPAAEDGWGRVPAWGVGEVLDTGETIYGLFPMASHVTLELDDGLVDRAEHRRALAPFYNRYLRSPADAEHVDETLLLRPLFATAFLLQDFLGDDEDPVVLGSASSKTAYSLAFLLRRAGRPVVGLTSPRNRSFVEALGVYDRVLGYDEVSELPGAPLVFVDMAGDGQVRAAVHATGKLRRSVAVGATHWERLASGAGDPRAPEPEPFFAPAHLDRMSEAIGAAELQRRLDAVWVPFVGRLGRWLEVEEHAGPDALERVWRSLVDGEADPSRGHIVRVPG